MIEFKKNKRLMRKSVKNVNKKMYSLESIFRFFCLNTSIFGLNKFGSKKTSTFERVFWIIFSLTVIVISGYFLQHLLSDYSNNPIVITADIADIPITDIKFPGVSICSFNKISKKRAHTFAEYLYTKPLVRETYRQKSDLLDAIKMLANLYDFKVSDKFAEANLQLILEKYDNLTTDNDPTERLVDLAPTCKEIFVKCKWGGIEYDCNKLFVTRATYVGYCCVFNYIRPITRSKIFHNDTTPRDIPVKARLAKGSGVKHGLQLVLKDNLDDYFVTTSEASGFMISIFNPLDFPDKSSGSLTEVAVDAGSEVFIRMDVSIVKPTSSIRILPASKRGCLFNDERLTDFGDYRNSDCYATCRLQIMNDLCNCIPFFNPVENMDYCTLNDLPCLNKFRRKWSTYYPTNEETSSLNFERLESIVCKECYPACNDEIYTASVDVLPIIINPTNNTYVNIFFERPFGNSYKRDITQTWYELLGNIGGYISLLMGLSFVSIVEILLLVYKLVVYVYYKYKPY